MAYSKPQVLAQNEKQGVYAAGCPSNSAHGGNTGSYCKCCECTE